MAGQSVRPSIIVDHSAPARGLSSYLSMEMTLTYQPRSFRILRMLFNTISMKHQIPSDGEVAVGGDSD